MTIRIIGITLNDPATPLSPISLPLITPIIELFAFRLNPNFSTMVNTITDILKRNHLSVTDGRKKILELFLQTKGAISHGDIEKRHGSLLDRVTIYRTLHSFEEKGIIHSIPTSDNSIRYAMCKDHCSEGHHHDNHVHFICIKCGKTICVDEVSVPNVQLPVGFKPAKVEMVISGECTNCDSPN